MRLDLSLPPLLRQDQQDSRFKVHIDDPLFVSKMGKSLARKLIKLNPRLLKPVVLLCIGTDRSTGDCLGPLIGTRLSSMGTTFFSVFGTLDNPVHATNLVLTLEQINNEFADPLILAIDACLGGVDSVGYVSLDDGSLRPGAGVHKDLPPVGELHVSGIVNVGGFMEYFVLQNTRLSVVMKMAEKISFGLISGHLLVTRAV